MKPIHSRLSAALFVSLLAAVPVPAVARSFTLTVQPSTATLAPGASTMVDVFLRDDTSDALATIGLSVATIRVEALTLAIPGTTSAELSAITPAAPFLTGPADPTPGVFTLFTPDPNFFGVLSTSGRLHIATLAITLPNTSLAAAPTRFGVTAFDDFQFISATDFRSESAASIGSATFDINVAAAAVPTPSPVLASAALLSAFGLVRRRNGRPD